MSAAVAPATRGTQAGESPDVPRMTGGGRFPTSLLESGRLHPFHGWCVHDISTSNKWDYWSDRCWRCAAGIPCTRRSRACWCWLLHSACPLYLCRSGLPVVELRGWWKLLWLNKKPACVSVIGYVRSSNSSTSSVSCSCTAPSRS
jgi:hypothetical protein